MTQVICDFCSSTDVHWSYPCRDFRTVRDYAVVAFSTTHGPESKDVHIDYGTSGGWAACNVCHALIERGDRVRLTRRAAKANLKTLGRKGGRMSLSNMIDLVRPLHDNFWANREGAPIFHETPPTEDPAR